MTESKTGATRCLFCGGLAHKVSLSRERKSHKPGFCPKDTDEGHSKATTASKNELINHVRQSVPLRPEGGREEGARERERESRTNSEV